MEEIEVPLEQSQEHIHHAAHAGKERWLTASALLSAILAVLAAIASLNAGHFVNEALLAQIHSSDQWGYYQAKGIKIALAEARLESLDEAQRPPIQQKLAKYEQDRSKSEHEAKEAAEQSERYLVQHETLAKAVTLFQIGIAMVAICVLVKRRWMLGVAMVLGGGGLWFLISGLA